MIDFDYDLLEEKLTVLIVRDAQSGAKLAYDCEVKGPGDDWVVEQLVRDFEVWGRTDIFLMSAESRRRSRCSKHWPRRGRAARR